jgi:hypothetical protein
MFGNAGMACFFRAGYRFPFAVMVQDVLRCAEL